MLNDLLKTYFLKIASITIYLHMNTHWYIHIGCVYRNFFSIFTLIYYKECQSKVNELLSTSSMNTTNKIEDTHFEEWYIIPQLNGHEQSLDSMKILINSPRWPIPMAAGVPEIFQLQRVWVIKCSQSILFHIFHTQKSKISSWHFLQT